MSCDSLLKQANLANLAGSPHINTALRGLNNTHEFSRLEMDCANTKK